MILVRNKPVYDFYGGQDKGGYYVIPCIKDSKTKSLIPVSEKEYVDDPDIQKEINKQTQLRKKIQKK